MAVTPPRCTTRPEPVLSKGPNAFRTISEAADEIGVPQHVLRFWETKFTFLKPMKRAGGRRFYRPQDLAILRGVKALLYTQGFKIEGVQRLYRERGLKHLLGAGGVTETEFATDDALTSSAGPSVDLPAGGRARLERLLSSLRSAKASLDALLNDPE